MRLFCVTKPANPRRRPAPSHRSVDQAVGAARRAGVPAPPTACSGYSSPSRSIPTSRNVGLRPADLRMVFHGSLARHTGNGVSIAAPTFVFDSKHTDRIVEVERIAVPIGSESDGSYAGAGMALLKRAVWL